jgi:thiosulfate/3-mercaptopyruvate sulfurtransferase
MKKNVWLKRSFFAGVLFLALLFSVSLVYSNALAFHSVPPLVETDWLADNLKKPHVRVVYVGFINEDDKAKFDSSHIANSVYLPMATLMGAMGDGSAPPDKAKFEAFMGDLGIGNDTHVVLYGDPAGNPFVPGAYWLMKYFGHKKVSLLNGSFAKWNAEKRATTSEVIDVKKTEYKAADGDESMRADADYVLKNIKNKDVVIVDVRSADEYAGKEDRNKRKGHIPGAINLNFYPTNRNGDGTYKTADALKKAYEAKGVTKDKEIITYCEGGVRAADSYIALRDILGYPRVKVYVGSWGEWGNRLDPEKYPLEK